MDGPSAAAEARGQSVTGLDDFWLQTVQDTIKQSITSLEEAAKQLIGAITLVVGIYFAAISFSGLKKAISPEGSAAWLQVALFVSPIVIWLICLFFAIRVFKPEDHYKTNLESPDMARDVYLEIVAYKHGELQKAYLFLLIGFIPLVAAVVYFLRYMIVP